jgi:hypothetical protein
LRSTRWACAFGSETIIKDPAKMLLTDTRTGITDGNIDIFCVAVSFAMDITFVFNGLDGIDNNIHEYLVQEPGIAADPGNAAVVLVEGNLAFPQVGGQYQYTLYSLVDIRFLEFGLIESGKGLQAFDNLIHPLAGQLADIISFFHLADHGQQFFIGGNGCFAFQHGNKHIKHLGVAVYRSQRCIDFMGDGSGKLTDGSHVFALDQQRLCVFDLPFYDQFL